MASFVSSKNTAVQNLDLLIDKQETFSGLHFLEIDENLLKLEAKRNLIRAVATVALGILVVVGIAFKVGFAGSAGIIAAILVSAVDVFFTSQFASKYFKAKKPIDDKENTINEICQVYNSIENFFIEQFQKKKNFVEAKVIADSSIQQNPTDFFNARVNGSTGYAGEYDRLTTNNFRVRQYAISLLQDHTFPSSLKKISSAWELCKKSIEIFVYGANGKNNVPTEKTEKTDENIGYFKYKFVSSTGEFIPSV